LYYYFGNDVGTLKHMQINTIAVPSIHFVSALVPNRLFVFDQIVNWYQI